MLATALLLLLDVITLTLPDGVVGMSYRARLQVKGGTPPYHFTLEESSLPRGLQLDPASGEISGVPRVADLDGARFTVVATDSSEPSERAVWNLTLRLARPLVMITRTMPQARAYEPYRVQMTAAGGRLPYRWEVVGSLPPGLELDPATGVITGTPTEGGEYDLRFRVSDSGTPPQREIFSFAARFLAPLAVRWKTAPHTEKSGIFGSLTASNDTNEDFDLTVVVVAVNEINKAFTLGYHHFRLSHGTSSTELPFGFSLPRGAYAVHADAVAEVPPRTIYRARLQQPRLQVEELR